MGIIAAALGGAGEGAMASGKQLGDYASRSALQQEEAAIQSARDQRLAELSRETHAVNADADIARIPARGAAENAVAEDKEKRLLPHKIAFEKGKEDAQAAGRLAGIPKEQLEYYKASAARLNAEAQAIQDGIKYRAKEAAAPKVQVPSVKEKVNEDGTVSLVDEHSGARGVIVKGSPEVPATSGFLGIGGKEGKPATQDQIQWFGPDGKPLPGGLYDLYPDLKTRAGAATPKPAGSPTAKRPSYGDVVGGYRFIGSGSADPNDKNNWEPSNRNSAPAPAKDTTPTATPAPKQEAAPADKTGASLDAARATLAAARSKLMTYGLVQKRNDPQGYANAQKAVEDAQRALSEAQAAYQQDVGEQPTARMPLRTK